MSMPFDYITPLTVYAAATQVFEICAARELSGGTVLKMAFAQLPLAEYGWGKRTTTIEKKPITKCSRGVDTQHWIIRKNQGEET